VKFLKAVAGFAIMSVASDIMLNFLTRAVGIDPREIGK
jgi:hypothetical protein